MTFNDFTRTENRNRGDERLYAIGRPWVAVLMLHGFPQTRRMWHGVASLLARDFAVVCADLRGYGASGCPHSISDHAPYSRRVMARDMGSRNGANSDFRASQSPDMVAAV